MRGILLSEVLFFIYSFFFIAFWDLNLISLPFCPLALASNSNFFWIYNELQNGSSKKMVQVTSRSVVISTLFYVIVGIFGTIAFGHRVEGNLLINMQGHWLFELSSFLMMVSTFLTFPLVITPCIVSLDSFLSFQKLSTRFTDYVHPIPPVRFAVEVFFVLSFALYVSFQTYHVEVFLSVTGALAGFTVGYILPSLFFLKISPDGAPLRKRAKALLLVSSVFAGLSVLAILKANFSGNELSAIEQTMPGLEPTLATSVALQQNQSLDLGSMIGDTGIGNSDLLPEST